ncbi:MAG: hypothetical protein NT128_03330 [Proteobacteria bacterium]|nr:hypothetical protein [Pseudomonadota bacterium]
MKKIMLALLVTSLGFLCAGDLNDQSSVSVRTTSNGVKVERFRFEKFPELEVVRHIMREIPGVHYFVNDYVKKGEVNYYRIYSCNCCLAHEQVIRRRNGTEEVLSRSDLELIHKIGNPTGQMLYEPWEHDLYPLPGRSSDYTSSRHELLLASL